MVITESSSAESQVYQVFMTFVVQLWLFARLHDGFPRTAATRVCTRRPHSTQGRETFSLDSQVKETSRKTSRKRLPQFRPKLDLGFLPVLRLIHMRPRQLSRVHVRHTRLKYTKLGTPSSQKEGTNHPLPPAAYRTSTGLENCAFADKN